MHKLVIGLFCLVASSTALADSPAIYVADDNHLLVDMLQMVEDAAQVIDGPKWLLIRDGQIAEIKHNLAAVALEASRQIQLFVCESDLVKQSKAELPPEVTVISVNLASLTKGRSTATRQIEKLCLE